jgi:hypothetical protein
VSLQLAAALGVAVLSSIATSRSKTLEAAHTALPSALTGGYRLGFAVGCGVVIASLLIALALLRPRPQARVEAALGNVEAAAVQTARSGGGLGAPRRSSAAP